MAHEQLQQSSGRSQSVTDILGRTTEYIKQQVQNTRDIRKEMRTPTGRRYLLTRKFKKDYLFPTEVIGHENAIEEAIKMKQEGYSFIVPYSHADLRGPIDLMTTLISLGEEFAEAPYLSPLALHQKKPYLDVLSQTTDIPLVPIVTRETVRKGKNTQPRSFKQNTKNFVRRITGKDVPLPVKLGEGNGFREYLSKGIQTLKEGGIVLVAPQGGRKNHLGEPAGPAVESLTCLAEKRGIEKIAVWPMAIYLKDTEIFNESTSGLNRRKTAKVEFGIPCTVGEMKSLAQENSTPENPLKIDQQVFLELAALLPATYVNPPQNRE